MQEIGDSAFAGRFIQGAIFKEEMNGEDTASRAGCDDYFQTIVQSIAINRTDINYGIRCCFLLRVGQYYHRDERRHRVQFPCQVFNFLGGDLRQIVVILLGEFVSMESELI